MIDATRRIAGVDEAGRGPIAGPLVVAAVILDPRRPIAGLGDSKKISAPRRERLYAQIIECAMAYALIEVDLATIAARNILGATLYGMRLALEALTPGADEAWIDGNQIPDGLPCPARALVGGDGLMPAIGAASILAKVHRDRLMHALDADYPDYGFAVHKGYPSPAHLAALQRLGPCAIHRAGFAPVRNLLKLA